MTTPYDRVVYPTAVFAQTHPERLAVLARLAGLDPVAPAEARILEVGGGDCMNLLAIAAAYPGCAAHGFDLSEVAINRGRMAAEASGLANVSLVVEDILEASARYPARSFDYVIVHGVYAWVPPPVREGVMALLGHVLSDRGVAFVSYNCMPGGHIRMILRETLLDAVGDSDDPDARIAAARDFLEGYARPQENDEPLATILREQAAAMLDRPDAVLFHDELGDCYYPQRLADVAAAGARHGLRHLTDAGRNRHLDGFLAEGVPVPPDPDAAVLRAAGRDDYRAMRYFRQTLFVRNEQVPDRRIDAARIAPLYLSTKMSRGADGTFRQAADTIEIADEELAQALQRAAAAYPQRVPVSEIARSPAQHRVVLQLFAEWYVNLHTAPAPFASRASAFPRASPLVHGRIATGELMLCTLDHGLLKIDQGELRALLMAADGTRSLAELAQIDHGIPADEVQDALDACAARALLSS